MVFLNFITDFLFGNWIITTLVALTGFYYLITHNLNYFEKRGVVFVKPLPLFGNSFKTIFHLENMSDTYQKYYKKFAKHRFFGYFEFLNPVYVICDPELIKQIGIKDFEHFMNHRGQFDEELEPIFSRNLFSMKDPKWRHMRTTLSPAFTGSKMRQMFELVGECSKEFIEFLQHDCKSRPVELEMKDFFTRFANDVIATSAFGVKTNSIKDKDNEFYKMGRVVTSFTGIRALKFLGFSAIPNIMKFFRITIVEEHINRFFRDMVMNTIKYREQNNVFRPDMINLLMQAKKEGTIKVEKDAKFDDAGFSTVVESSTLTSNTKTMKWEDDDLVGQCFVFFLAGFDTISQMMSFMAHELAINPDIQKQLRDEVDEVREQLGNKPITYEVLQNMKYLDMVVSETLRKWPPVIAIDRHCTKSYIMETAEGKKVQLNPGDGLWFPIHSLHHDPQYYPNPGKFDPERFSDENKGNINPNTYLPFGIGPRNCIGSRFALMEAKAIYFHLLSSFFIEPSPKTQNPIKLKNESFSSVPEKGNWVQFRARA